MKHLHLDLDVEDEDCELFLKNEAHLRVYNNGIGHAACVVVPREEEDLLDKKMMDCVSLNHVNCPQ